jgi:hypothetical protein
MAGRLARAAALAGLTVTAGLAAAPGLAPPLGPGAAAAQALDPGAAEALAAATRMLLDPAQRAAAIAGTPQAGGLDREVRALTGSDALTQELYALAADVFAELARQSGGDVAKMTEALERGRTDPAGFAAMLSPQTLERLQALATRISDQRR